MIGYPQDQKSFARARDMAHKGGLDLTLAVFEGWLRRDELERLVAACHDCAAGYPCESWLKPGAPDAAALSLPPGCGNSQSFQALLNP